MEQTAGYLNALLSADSSCWPIPERRKLSRGMDLSKFEGNTYCVRSKASFQNKQEPDRKAQPCSGRWNLGYIQRLDLKSK